MKIFALSHLPDTFEAFDGYDEPAEPELPAVAVWRAGQRRTFRGTSGHHETALAMLAALVTFEEGAEMAREWWGR